MTIDVVTEITIVRSIEAVAEYAADPDNAPGWYDNITSIVWESERPLQVGSRIAFTAEFMGRRMTYTYEVDEYDPMSRLVMRTAEGPFPMETTYSWKRESDKSTHMTLRTPWMLVT